MPLFSKYFYGKINSAITKVLFVIYGIPYGLSFKQSQRKLFSMAGWVPFHLLHKKAILNFTNRILMYDICPNILDYLKTHLIYNDMSLVPFGLNLFRSRARRIMALQKTYIFYLDDDVISDRQQKFFPYNLESALNELPEHISLQLGNPGFKFYIKSHFYARCPHGIYKTAFECSECSITLYIPDFIIQDLNCPLNKALNLNPFLTHSDFNQRAQSILQHIL